MKQFVTRKQLMKTSGLLLAGLISLQNILIPVTQAQVAPDPTNGVEIKSANGTNYTFTTNKAANASFTAFTITSNKKTDSKGRQLYTEETVCAAPTQVPYGTKIRITGTGTSWDNKMCVVVDSNSKTIVKDDGTMVISLLVKDQAQVDSFGTKSGQMNILTIGDGSTLDLTQIAAREQQTLDRTNSRYQPVDLIYHSNNNILFYNPERCIPNPAAGGSNPNGASDIVGNDNLEKILRFFTEKMGMTLAQAAGIAGNFKQESGFLPGKIENVGKQADASYVPVPGVGFGLAQWTYSGRQQQLIKFAKETKRTIIDFNMQLEFTAKELAESYSSTLKKMAAVPNDPMKNAIIFHDGYEGSADSDEKVIRVRGKPAEEYYAAFKGTIPDGTGVKLDGVAISTGGNGGTPTSTSGVDYCFSPGSNIVGSSNLTGNAIEWNDVKGSGVIPEGSFLVFRQNLGSGQADDWANIAYNGDTISDSGCGPTAMAMIVTALTGKIYTPAEAAADFKAAGGIDYSGGTMAEPAVSLMKKKFGFTSSTINKSSQGAIIAQINAILDKGGVAYVSGRGVPNSPMPKPHFIVIRAKTSDGKFIIGQPYKPWADPRDDSGWDPYIIAKAMMNGGGGIYGIYNGATAI